MKAHDDQVDDALEAVEKTVDLVEKKAQDLKKENDAKMRLLLNCKKTLKVERVD